MGAQSNYFATFIAQALTQRLGRLMQGKRHTSTRVLPSLSKSQATHNMSHANFGAGISTDYQTLRLHSRLRTNYDHTQTLNCSNKHEAFIPSLAEDVFESVSRVYNVTSPVQLLRSKGSLSLQAPLSSNSTNSR